MIRTQVEEMFGPELRAIGALLKQRPQDNSAQMYETICLILVERRTGQLHTKLAGLLRTLGASRHAKAPERGMMLSDFRPAKNEVSEPAPLTNGGTC